MRTSCPLMTISEEDFKSVGVGRVGAIEMRILERSQN
jgi:hypothetical protein